MERIEAQQLALAEECPLETEPSPPDELFQALASMTRLVLRPTAVLGSPSANELNVRDWTSVPQQHGELFVKGTLLSSDPETTVTKHRESPNDDGQLYVISQTSETVSFTLKSKLFSFRMFFEPSGDNLILQYDVLQKIKLTRINENGTVVDSRIIDQSTVPPLVIYPGPWRVTDEQGRHLFDFLVLRRRYELRLANNSAVESGSKRKAESNETKEKRQRLLPGDEHFVVISTESVCKLGLPLLLL